MEQNALAKKLKLKEGQKAAVINAPEGFLEALMPLPEGVIPETAAEGEYDFIHLFVRNKAEVDALAPDAIRALKPHGIFWISYPKQSAKLKTDINRDKGWDVLAAADFEGVAMVSVDDTWSAVRFRPAAELKTANRRLTASEGKAAEALDTCSKTVTVPDDFKALLSANEKAQAFFESLAYTYKKEYVSWINDAKREQTRQDRLQKSIEKLQNRQKLRQ